MTTLLEPPVAAKLPVSPVLDPLDITDENLMGLIQQRNPEALGILHDRHASTLKALIMRVLHNESDAEDMLQEIFVEIWDRSGSYDPAKGKALGWIVTLSRRRAIDRLRKRDARSRAEERLQEEVKREPEAGITDVQNDLAMGDVREMLQRLLGKLPPAQKHVIELAYYRGMSQREIAAHTGIPLGTIKTRLELGLKKISVELEGIEAYL